jgi:hypothetical protein
MTEGFINKATERIRYINIALTETEHRELKMYKSYLGLTWKELLVDFYLEQLRALQKGNIHLKILFDKKFNDE